MMTEAAPPASPLRGIKSEALTALKNYMQADADGVMVYVSRQALDEAIAALSSTVRSPDPDTMNDEHMLEDMKLAHNVRKSAIEECARLIESGAGMADLIDQEELDQQAKYIRNLAALPSTDGKARL